jgi:pimeloyl-ACP methyl ester carboxylesterase
MMFRLHCTCAIVLGLAAPCLAQQVPAAATNKPTTYRVFMRGTAIGREDVTIEKNASGLTVTSQGRLAAPLNVDIKRAQFKYRPDWSPEAFSLEGNTNNAEVSVRTSFNGTTAVTQGTQGGKPVNVSHTVTADTVILPGGVFSAFAALSHRLVGIPPKTRLRAYVLPEAEIGLNVLDVVNERMQVGTTLLNVRRYDLVLGTLKGDLPISLIAAEDGSLVRVGIPSQGVDLVREDVASPTSRTQVYSNPSDEPVIIPAQGFNIGATLTRPKAGTGARLPAVVLLGSASAGDRDGFLNGVPILGQLAGALADAGFLVVRYDRRGFGQSGGRSESATIVDSAEDARVVVRWLSDRKDVDPKRVALVGHAEGAWIAILTANRERRIAAVASIAGASTTGAELNLEQQQYELNQLSLPAAERAKKIALQKQIQSAVMTGKGWESIPANERRDADTPWFHSYLMFDPTKTVSDLKQPILIVHGALDKEIPPAHADRLTDLARKSDSKSVEVVVIRGINHLLIPAFTGDLGEYPSLTDRNVSKDVSGAVGAWLTKTFAAIK